MLIAMEDSNLNTPLSDGADVRTAHRAFEEFVTIYRPTLISVEHHLEQIIEQVEPIYAEAYRPWHKSLQDLIQGSYLIAKKIPLSDPDSLLEALRVFNFDSAVQFLLDICISCKLVLPYDWADRFHKHIEFLLASFAILRRQQQEQALAH